MPLSLRNEQKSYGTIWISLTQVWVTERKKASPQTKLRTPIAYKHPETLRGRSLLQATAMVPRTVAGKAEPCIMNVSELRDGMRSVNVQGRITSISSVRNVVTRSGQPSRVATADLADDSGTVKLTLWNENIEAVSVGDTIQVENGYVTSFRGETQLNVGRYGRIIPVP